MKSPSCNRLAVPRRMPSAQSIQTFKRLSCLGSFAAAIPFREEGEGRKEQGPSQPATKGSEFDPQESTDRPTNQAERCLRIVSAPLPSRPFSLPHV